MSPHKTVSLRRAISGLRAAAWMARFALRSAGLGLGRLLGLAPPRPGIGLVVGSFDKGGLEQVVLNLYRTYKTMDYPAYLLVQDNHVGGLARYLESPRDMRIFLGDKNDFFRFCWKHNIRALHYHYNTFGISRARLYGIKTMYTLHNAYTWMNDADFQAHARQVLEADCIIAVSEFVKSYFCARSGTPAGQVKAIPNGVDSGELLEGNHLDREAMGLDRGAFVFVNIASFHQVKHHAVMIGAMEQVLKTHPHARLLFVGNIGDQAYHQQVVKLLDASPARNAIRHVPYLPREEVGALLKHVADCMLLPSIQEGCSNAVLEALYCRTPMILSDVGNAREVLQETKSGILIPPAFEDIMAVTPRAIAALSESPRTRNVDALVDAMVEMVNNHAAYKARADTASSAMEQYSVARMTRAYVAEVMSLLGGRRFRLLTRGNLS